MEKERIEDYIEYDETSSTYLRWKKSPSRKVKQGNEVGGYDKTLHYMGLRFNKKNYLTHRVVWYLHHKVWSTREFPINHIDGDRTNNRISNLELISSRENNIHLNRKVNRNNVSSGVRGIRYDEETDKYLVILFGIYRGRRDTLEEGKELWNKCYELDKQGIVHKEISQPRKEVEEGRGVELKSNGKYQISYKNIYRGYKNTLEEGKELYRKCVELDKEGIVYKELKNRKRR